MLLSPSIRILFSQREKSLKLNGLWGKDSNSVLSPVSLHPQNTEYKKQLGLRIVYFKLTNMLKTWTNIQCAYMYIPNYTCIYFTKMCGMYTHTTDSSKCRATLKPTHMHTISINYPHKEVIASNELSSLPRSLPFRLPVYSCKTTEILLLFFLLGTRDAVVGEDWRVRAELAKHN